MNIEEGHIRISGHATKSPGSVDFSMNAVPHLVRPGHHEEWDEEYGEHFSIDTPARDELWFEMRDVDVDIHRDWWVYLLEVLGGVITVGVGVAIVEAMVTMVRDNISSAVSHQSDRAFASRNQSFLLAGTTEPLVALRIERFEAHAVGAFAAMTLRPQFGAASVRGPAYITPEERPTAVLRYTVKLPFDGHPADPQLHVRWTLRRRDTHAIVAEVDRPAGAALDFDADLRAPELMPCPQYEIACRVYRTLGASVVDLFNGTCTLYVRDRLDRTHPYVRWRHSPFTPNVRVETNGTHTLVGYNHPERVSAIHRTAVPGRCRMVNRFSPKVPAGQPEYLDALPFPLADLVANRDVLCDYCFFGGPTKSVPLIPTV